MRSVPHVYVLELACDGCVGPGEVITSPSEDAAFGEAVGRGWRFREHLTFCPRCSKRPN